jgi:hypothetical protein
MQKYNRVIQNDEFSDAESVPNKDFLSFAQLLALFLSLVSIVLIYLFFKGF